MLNHKYKIKCNNILFINKKIITIYEIVKEILNELTINITSPWNVDCN